MVRLWRYQQGICLVTGHWIFCWRFHWKFPPLLSRQARALIQDHHLKVCYLTFASCTDYGKILTIGCTKTHTMHSKVTNYSGSHDFPLSLSTSHLSLGQLQPFLFQIESTKTSANSLPNQDQTPAEPVLCISYSIMAFYCKFTLLSTCPSYKSHKIEALWALDAFKK